MSAKTSAARRAAFFKALAETGNATVSAERAKVSRSWVQLHRNEDPEFRAAYEAAKDDARERLEAHGARKPPSGWGTLDGEELVVRGTNGRRVQIARARIRQWTPRVEDRFLATLGATCNVKAACAEAGMTQASAYQHRHRWRGFAERWDAAIEQGYVRLETGLIENACNIFSSPEFPPDAPIAPMTADQAIHLLHMHKHRVHGIGGRPGAPLTPADPEVARASIMRAIAAIKRGRKISKAQRERDEREWSRRRSSG